MGWIVTCLGFSATVRSVRTRRVGAGRASNERHGRAHIIVTEKLRPYGAAMKAIGSAEKTRNLNRPEFVGDHQLK
jgi:hypothetical protein